MIFYNQPSNLVYLLQDIFNSWNFIKYFTNSNSLAISSNHFNHHFFSPPPPPSPLLPPPPPFSLPLHHQHLHLTTTSIAPPFPHLSSPPLSPSLWPSHHHHHHHRLTTTSSSTIFTTTTTTTSLSFTTTMTTSPPLPSSHHYLLHHHYHWEIFYI